MDAPISNFVNIAMLIGERAGNLFLSRQLHCSEAVLVTLNRALGGGLKEHQAIALAAAFSEGVGKTGCMCGALGGALMGLGLFIGGTNPTRRRADVQRASGDLVKGFKARFGSACCRVLSKKPSAASTSQFHHCFELTSCAAAIAAELIIADRPELEPAADYAFLRTRDSAVGALIRTALRCVGC